MAEEKKIRVSVDTSPLRTVENEMNRLQRTLLNNDELANAQSREAIDNLREQLNLRRELSDLGVPWDVEVRRDVPRDITPTPNAERQRERANQRKSEEKEEEPDTTPSPMAEERQEEVKKRKKRRSSHVDEFIENSFGSEGINNLISSLNKMDSTLESIDSKIAPSLEDFRTSINGFLGRLEEMGGISSRGEGSGNTENLSNIINQLFSSDNEILSLLNLIVTQQRSGNKTMSSLLESVQSIDESVYNILNNGGQPPTPPGPIPVPIPPTPTPNPNPSNNQNNREEGHRRDAGKNVGTRIIAGMGSSASQSPVSAGGALISTAGGITGELLGMIPGVGGFLGGIATAAGNAMASMFTTSIEKALEAQKKATLYSQTMGVSNASAMRTASSEGSYAASALGMNIGDYIQRRAELIRTAGGKQDISTVPETQSLMSVQRLYGLSPTSVNSMQSAMRFSSGENGDTQSSSAIIRSFEQTMRQLGLPISEVASTLEESISTFTKTADDILSRAGEIDAGKIAAVMRAVRLTTGMEGRQLERVQQTFTGQGISQDQVTQTLLMRAIQRVTGAQTYSDVMAERDNLGNNPDIILQLIQELRELTKGDEQFRIVLHSAFSKLSWSDVRSLTAPGTDFKDLEKKIKEGLKATEKENDAINQYAPESAQRTVSSGEAIMSAYENMMIGFGGENIKILNEMMPLIRSLSVATQALLNFIVSTGKPGDLISQIADPKTRQPAVQMASIAPGLLLEAWIRNLWDKWDGGR